MLISFFAALLALAPSDTIPLASRVIIVRHAEKASQTERDPSLSEIGKARAMALDSALAGTKISAIFVTSYKRTTETAVHVAARNGVTPSALNPADIPTYARALADSVAAHSGIVLIISHSNTIPAILEALGGKKIPDLCDPAYSHLFSVVPGKPATVTDSRYGAKDAEGADSCH